MAATGEEQGCPYNLPSNVNLHERQQPMQGKMRRPILSGRMVALTKR